MARALVTGGGGFIGSNLVRALLERGDDVRVLDNFSTGNRANLEGLGIEIVEGELRSYERVHNAVRGIGGRLPPRRARLGAALRAGPADVERGQRRRDAERPARCARRRRPPGRLLLVDVGLRLEPASCPRRRARRPTRSRRTASRSSPPSGTASASPASTTRFETVVLRYFNVFGERQSPFSQYAAVVPLFVTAIAAGLPVEIHGDGEQSRDFTYVGNVVDATLRAGDAEGASGEIFNIAAGSPGSVNLLADTIGTILGKPVEKRLRLPRAGDIRDSWADLAKAERILGYRAGDRPRGRPAPHDRLPDA